MPPGELVSLTNLEHLLLDHNQLTMLPTGFGDLMNLIVLSLSHNNLAFLPSEIGNLNHLSELWLVNVQLIALPEEICLLKKLIKLGVGENLLSGLPENFSNLQALEWLSLRKNQITSLPNDLHQLKHLTFVDVSENRLQHIPNSLQRSKSLSYLKLSHNNLSIRPGDFSKGFPSLHKLDLRHTNVETLPKGSLKFEVLLSNAGFDDMKCKPCWIRCIKDWSWVSKTAVLFSKDSSVDIWVFYCDQEIQIQKILTQIIQKILIVHGFPNKTHMLQANSTSYSNNIARTIT